MSSSNSEGIGFVGVNMGRENPTKEKLGTRTQSPLPNFVICPCMEMAAGIGSPEMSLNNRIKRVGVSEACLYKNQEAS